MTFWHVNQYYLKATASMATRIGKFDFLGGGGSPTPTPTATPSSCSWSAGPDIPSAGTRSVGCFSLLTGSFTRWAAATSIMSSSLIRLSTTRQLTRWTTKSATYPDDSRKQHGLRRAQ